MKIAVSYLSSYYSQEQTLNLIEQTTAEYIHVDLMDGVFVAQKNFKIKDTLNLLKNHNKPLDIHLMVLDPIFYIKELSKLQPEYITFHLEATKDIVKTIELIKKLNIKVGLSIKPETPINELIPYMPFIDLILIMCVEPGKGGQEFLPISIDRIKELNEIKEQSHYSFKVEVDGGINVNTIEKLPAVDIIVSGSFVCHSTDFQTQINLLKNNAANNHKNVDKL